MLFTLLRRPVDVYPSWWRYEGVRMTRGQGLLPWIADNPNIQVRCRRAACVVGQAGGHTVISSSLLRPPP